MCKVAFWNAIVKGFLTRTLAKYVAQIWIGVLETWQLLTIWGENILFSICMVGLLEKIGLLAINENHVLF